MFSVVNELLYITEDRKKQSCKAQAHMGNHPDSLIKRALAPFYLLIERVEYHGNGKVDDCRRGIACNPEYNRQYNKSSIGPAVDFEGVDSIAG